MTQPTRHRVGGLLVDSCPTTRPHGPHTQDGGALHCPGHPAPPPEQLAGGRPTASDRDTVQTARQLRREQLAVLLSRAARGVLTPAEGPLLRANVETELADANTAYLELDNQRETFDIAWEQQDADLERARGIAVQLENENRRLEHELKDSRRVAEFYMQENGKNLAAISRVRDYADELCAEPHPTHDHVCPDEVRKGLRAALDSGEQPGPAVEESP